MKSIVVLIFGTLLMLSNVSGQSGKYPKNLEQVSSCAPCGTDTAGAFYRHAIDGYADKFSAAQADSISFYIGVKDSALLSGVADTIKIYRYGPSGWQFKFNAGTHNLIYYPFHYVNGQPVDYKAGAQWSKSKTVYIDPSWQSGFYSAQMTAKKNGVTYAGALPFVVKENQPGSTSSILWVVPMNTYNAYNTWGGTGLYWPNCPGINNAIYQTDTVTFDRPFNTNDLGNTYDSLGHFPQGSESSWAQWLEGHGYTIEYCADYDIDQTPNTLLPNYKMVLIPGHTEYWSNGMRNNMTNYVKNTLTDPPSNYGGGNVAFFSANTCYWFVTYAGTNGRKMVVDKCDNNADLWRAGIHNNPEAKLVGVQLSVVNDSNISQIAQKPSHWIFKNTSITSAGQHFGSYANQGIAAGESDDTVRGQSPSNVQVLARVQTAYSPNPIGYSTMSYYIDTSGNGRVFDAGGGGWHLGLGGTDSTSLGTMTRNIIDHFRWNKYIDTIFANVRFDQNIEIFGNTWLRPGRTLTLTNNAVVTIDSCDTLFVDGTLQLGSNITISGPGYIYVRTGGNFQIDSGKTLTLSGNAGLKFDGGYTFTVRGQLVANAGSQVLFGSGDTCKIYGSLRARGTSGNHVVFTSSAQNPASGDWYGLFLNGGADSLNYCDIQYAQYGVVTQNQNSHFILSSTISSCSQYGISASNCGLSAMLYIKDCAIHDNLVGIGLNSSYAYLINTDVYNSSDVYGGVYCYNSHIYLSATGIFSNSGPGVYVSGSTGYAWFMPPGLAAGNNYAYSNDINLYVPQGGAYLGEYVTYSYCDCGDPGGTKVNPGGGKNMRQISNTGGCSPGCTLRYSSYVNGGYNHVYSSTNGYTITTASAIKAHETYWDECPPQSSRFSGTVDASYCYEQPSNLPKAGFSRNPVVEGLRGNASITAEESDSVRIVRHIRHLLANFNQDGNPSLDDLHQLMGMLGLNASYQNIVGTNRGMLLSSLTSPRFSLPLRILATEYAVQSKIDSEDYAGALELISQLPVAAVNEHWIFAKSQQVNCYLHLGDTANARIALNDLKANATAVDPDAVRFVEGSYSLLIRSGLSAVLQSSNHSGKGAITVKNKDGAKSFALNGNYPNPFNPVTQIQYQLPVESKVTLRIYNTLGQLVTTLIDGVQSAGFKSFTFNGNNLPSGVYFYRLQAGNFSDVKKFVLMK